MPPDLRRYAGGLDHRAAWMRVGFHSRDLASDRFTTVFPGYLTPTSHPVSVNSMGWSLQNEVCPGGVLSHTTAALLWGIPMPAGLEGGVDLLRRPDLPVRRGVVVIPSVRPGRTIGVDASLPVLHCRVERGGTSRVGRGAVVHRGRRGAPALLDNLVVSSQVETLRELATMLPLWDVVAAVEAVIGPQSQRPGESLASLTAAAAVQSGRSGLARLRSALALARGGVRSPGETIIRLVLDSTGFPRAEVNHLVVDPDTGTWREIDLAWESLGLGLEYDGDGHRTKEQWRKDEARRDELASRGWTLARATGGDLWTPGRLLLRLRRTMAQRGAKVPSEGQVRRALQDLATKRPTLRISARQA